MNTRKVAAALNTISVAFGELAEALIEQPGQATETSRGTGVAPSGNPAPVTPTPVYPPGPASADYYEPGPLDETSLLDEIFPDDVKAPPRQEPAQGSLAMCPRHKRPFSPSKFKGKPPYCQAKSDDPVWSHNGFCSINASNVQTFLQAVGAPA
jgi:hypothetical protein